MNSSIQCLRLKKLLLPFCLLVSFVFFNFRAIAQEQPPKPIAVTVNVLQHLNFGTIIPSGTGGGTVTVDDRGYRTCSGQIILPPVGTFSSPALFEVTALPGTLITIVNGSDTYLSGSNTGSIKLTVGASSTGSPFVTKSTTTEVFIGGTLTIGSLAANPAGSYSGTFSVTFIQQ